jgi:single-strand DNA-binding protein
VAKDLNKVQMTGNLGADPEMRYTAQGSAVTSFRVASNRSWKDRDGNPHEDTEWFRIVAWDKLGEICNQYLTKGSRVYVEGRLQTRKWTDQSGQERYTSEVIAQDMIILSSRNGERGAQPEAEGNYEEYPEESAPAAPAAPPARRPVASAPAAAPAGNGTRSAAAPARPAARATRNTPQPIEGDDDIPF